MAKTKPAQPAVYDENSILHLDGLEHIRLRPGMYIGSLGDGSNENDGIYILLKEGIDNAVDEFSQGAGTKIDIEIKDGRVKIVRDYSKTTLTLITCTKDDLSSQTVYIFELV